MEFNESEGPHVPVYDPLDAYSMSLEREPSITFSHSGLNQNEEYSLQSMDRAGESGVVDLSPIQTAGLTLTPVGAPTSIQTQSDENLAGGGGNMDPINYSMTANPSDRAPTASNEQSYMPPDSSHLAPPPLYNVPTQPRLQLSPVTTVSDPTYHPPSGAPPYIYSHPPQPTILTSTTSPTVTGQFNHQQLSPSVGYPQHTHQPPVHHPHQIANTAGGGVNLLGGLEAPPAYPQSVAAYRQDTTPSAYEMPPPPPYQHFISDKHQDEAPGGSGQHFSHPQLRTPALPFPTQPQPMFTKVVSGDKTIMYSQAKPPTHHGFAPTSALPHGYSSSHSPVKASPKKEASASSFISQEFANIPGLNLKKASVEVNVYVASLAAHHHPTFANIDNYAERCLACVVRKIKNNLPALQTLLRSVSRRDGDAIQTDCVCIPRTKDCRITVARGKGSSSTKRIHPHLALFQIFSNPQAQMVNLLEPIERCKFPYIPGPNLGEMCINPSHYKLVKPASKSAVNKSVNQSPSKIRSKKSQEQSPTKMLQEEDSDSDFLSDASDSVDWEAEWRDKSQPAPVQPQIQFNDEELLKEIQYLTLKKDKSGIRPKPASTKLLHSMKIIDDLRCLFKGKYDLQTFSSSSQKKIRTKTRKYLEAERDDLESDSLPVHTPSEYNQKIPLSLPLPVPTENDDPVVNLSLMCTTTSQHAAVESSSLTVFPSDQVKVKEEVLMEDGDCVDNSVIDKSRKKDDLEIQDLLENIKGSFEDDLDMELDSFNPDESELNNEDFQQFSIANTFSMSGINEVTSQDTGEVINNDESFDTTSGDDGRAGAADALLGAGSSMDDEGEELPCIVNSWTVEGGETDQNFLMFDS